MSEQKSITKAGNKRKRGNVNEKDQSTTKRQHTNDQDTVLFLPITMTTPLRRLRNDQKQDIVYIQHLQLPKQINKQHMRINYGSLNMYHQKFNSFTNQSSTKPRTIMLTLKESIYCYTLFYHVTNAKIQNKKNYDCSGMLSMPIDRKYSSTGFFLGRRESLHFVIV